MKEDAKIELTEAQKALCTRWRHIVPAFVRLISVSEAMWGLRFLSGEETSMRASKWSVVGLLCAVCFCSALMAWGAAEVPTPVPSKDVMAVSEWLPAQSPISAST